MSLRMALLALLAARPMTGFDAMRQFDVSVDYLWHAPHTQIYPELRKLEAAGLVDGEEVPRGEHARKRRYSLTEAGREQLRAWVEEVEEPRRERDPQRLKAAYFEWASPQAARAQLEAHARFHEDALASYEKQREDILARRVPLLQARLERTPPSEQEAVVEFKAFAYDGLIARARAEVEWAQEGLRLLDRLHPERSEGEASEQPDA
ncbi:PadR family transcriptional regulator [Streptomyces sp. NL15-2K]|uniref:PadR family transcriptional regulator n=1 Tax=Streptomyces sp. NL15-2K TaxID=376149 RepID=UPI000F583680|nr:MULTISPECIES: helix-turn-helix transcriptional regulator [Actinomycetes]WKX06679.1 helix-turn-helix transcriptional regulator [Kutzneria buriramensis]GCB43706.1 padR family transcriptional regulator [Streptomyces sp. NL15-2K]